MVREKRYRQRILDISHFGKNMEISFSRDFPISNQDQPIMRRYLKVNEAIKFDGENTKSITFSLQKTAEELKLQLDNNSTDYKKMSNNTNLAKYYSKKACFSLRKYLSGPISHATLVTAITNLFPNTAAIFKFTWQKNEWIRPVQPTEDITTEDITNATTNTVIQPT